MAKIPRYLYYLGGGALALLVYTFATAPEAPTTRKANNSFQAGTSRKKGDDTYRPEDYTAKFPPVNVAPRDAFKPLVVKTTTTLTTAQPTPLAPNGIPALFAAGDGNWIYTGNAEVDGVPNALLENTASQETVFLRPGERWKNLTLAGVTTNQIELIGPTGQRRSVQIADETAPSTTPATSAAPAGTAPGTLPAAVPNGRGALTGPIGNDPNAQSAQGTPGQGRGNRRQRGNRRNNRNNPNDAGIAPVGAFQTP